MAFRRLGTTDALVSELGVDVRGALSGGVEAAEETLRAALDAGITVFSWDVSDATDDVEPLIVRVSGTNRGRLTLVAALDVMPSAPAMGPQVEAVAARLATEGAEGYVDVIALPGVPDPAQWEALREVRARGIARFVAVMAHGDAHLPAPLPPEVDLLLLTGAPTSEHRAGGVIARVRMEEAPVLLRSGSASCVIAPAASPADVRRLVMMASVRPAGD